jgi:hypothetical protein
VILVHVDHIVFRLPLYMRILSVVGVGIVGGSFIPAIIGDHASRGSIVATLVFVTLAAALGYRQYGLAVTVRGDELVVRNYWTTHHVPRDHIRGFDRGRPSMGSGTTIRVDTGMSTVPLDALTVWPEALNRSSSAYYRREHALELLSDWADKRPDPHRS